MMRSTSVSRLHHISRISGGAPAQYTKQPYFIRNAYANPYIGAQHDGVTTDFAGGYTVKPMHWLYRYRFNTAPTGSTPLYLRNPGGKMAHWLEVTWTGKAINFIVNEEFLGHLVCFILICTLVTWQLGRYMFFHPELSMYNIVMYPTKDYVDIFRYNNRHPMDKPVFRWFQRAPEFYAYDQYRDFIEMGVIANDPYVEYMKSIGKEKDLVKYPQDISRRHQYLPELLPREWRWSHGHNGDNSMGH